MDEAQRDLLMRSLQSFGLYIEKSRNTSRNAGKTPVLVLFELIQHFNREQSK